MGVAASSTRGKSRHKGPADPPLTPQASVDSVPSWHRTYSQGDDETFAQYVSRLEVTGAASPPKAAASTSSPKAAWSLPDLLIPTSVAAHTLPPPPAPGHAPAQLQKLRSMPDLLNMARAASNLFVPRNHVSLRRTKTVAAHKLPPPPSPDHASAQCTTRTASIPELLNIARLSSNCFVAGQGDDESNAQFFSRLKSTVDPSSRAFADVFESAEEPATEVAGSTSVAQCVSRLTPTVSRAASNFFETAEEPATPPRPSSPAAEVANTSRGAAQCFSRLKSTADPSSRAASDVFEPAEEPRLCSRAAEVAGGLFESRGVSRLNSAVDASSPTAASAVPLHDALLRTDKWRFSPDLGRSMWPTFDIFESADEPLSRTERRESTRSAASFPENGLTANDAAPPEEQPGTPRSAAFPTENAGPP
ncbi:hypothetical protein T484DRAFT_1765864 [Baffinella frigidus]|nr:hypothetical protein T484DRAFT_1765864 [Cryptophyta sp. CCMP2293]